MNKIKLLVMDVDGTLTDGKINMGINGEVFKSFDIKDGYGIHEILPKHSIKSVIITGRNSEIVGNRAEELEIDYVYQGIKDKLAILKEVMEQNSATFKEVAYIGDDFIDYECMKLCGVSGCPSDAAKEIIEIVDFVAIRKGGEGAVREFIEWIVK